MKGYKLTRYFFSALLGGVIFLSSSSLAVQKSIDKEFADVPFKRMNNRTHFITGVISDSLHRPQNFFNRSKTHTDDPETILTSPSGGMGWGTISEVIP